MNKVVEFFAQRRKTLISVAGIALTLAAEHWGQTNQYVVYAIGAFAVLGIHEVPNKPILLFEDILAACTAMFKPVDPKPAPTPVVVHTPDPPPPAIPLEPRPPLSPNVVEEWGRV